MDNENKTNRDVTVTVGPNLGLVGGQGGENGAPPAEGLGTIGGGGRGATDDGNVAID